MIKVKIPTSLSEITLRQYKHFLKISEDVKSDNFMNAKMVEIFCSLKLAEVMKLEVNAVDEIVEMISKLFEQKPALVTRFELNGTDYGFHTGLDNMSLGEYIDLDNNIGDWPNIERAMNVLYRPVVSKLKEKYSIAEYEVGNEADILDMPMDAVLSSVFFFVEFRDGIIASYDELFGGGGNGSLDEISQFSTKWGWYQSIYSLSDGLITRFESITKLGLHECLQMLTFKKEKTEIENKQMKKKFN